MPDLDARMKKRADFARGRWGRGLLAAAARDHSMPKEHADDPVACLVGAVPPGQGGYLDWVCRVYAAGSFLAEDVARVATTLSLFHAWKRRLPEEARDVNAYRDEQALWEAVRKFDASQGEDDGDTPQGRELKRRERARAHAESEVLYPEEADGWTVASPLTHEASRWWARGTRWCTGMAGATHWEHYHRMGPLRVLVDPEGVKSQVHVATLGAADAADRPLKLADLLGKLPPGVLAVLRRDAERASREAVGNWRGEDGPASFVLSCPASLRTEAMVTEAISHARRCAEEAPSVSVGGWRLRLLKGVFARWGAGSLFSPLNLDSTGHKIAMPVWLLEKDGGKVFECQSDLTGKRARETYGSLGGALRETGPDFLAAAVPFVVANMDRGFPDAVFAEAISGFMEALPGGTLTRDGWLEYARGCTKTDHAFTVLPKPPHELVDDEIADAFAPASLDPVPDAMLTKERLLACLDRKPDRLCDPRFRARVHHLVDRDVLLCVARAKKGRGLSWIPAGRAGADVIMEVLSEFPMAAQHAHVMDLVDLGRDRLMTVVAARGSAILAMPAWVRSDPAAWRLALSAPLPPEPHQVPVEFRTRENLTSMLENAPVHFVHVAFPLPYGIYLEAVARNGSLLARVPPAYRDAEMCAAALRKQKDAWLHVPPATGALLLEDSTDPEFFGLVRQASRIGFSSRYPADSEARTVVPPAPGDRPEALPPWSARGGASLDACAKAA